MTELTTVSGIPRLLAPGDLPALMQLKETASWNQTERDWLRVLALEPEGCFGIDCDGTLAASATTVCYGTDVAWIGLVLTLPEFRGRGLARLLMEQCLDYAGRRGVRWAKLDATDMGAPLYAKLGFEPECTVERRMRPPAPPVAAPNDLGAAPDFELDRRAFGACRKALLASLASEGVASAGAEGFAMARSGSRAAYFGPCAATSAAAARPLLEWFLSTHPNEPVYWDVLPDNAAAAALAEEYGFVPLRRLVRMSRRLVPDAPPVSHDISLTFAIAGFEFG
jgi:GNAT superfamily N-acetyltransferase